MGWGVLHACTCSRRRTHKIRQTHTDAHEGQYALEREHFMPLLDLLIAGAELEAKRFVVVDALLEASPPQILELAHDEARSRHGRAPLRQPEPGQSGLGAGVST